MTARGETNRKAPDENLPAGAVVPPEAPISELTAGPRLKCELDTAPNLRPNIQVRNLAAAREWLIDRIAERAVELFEQEREQEADSQD